MHPPLRFLFNTSCLIISLIPSGSLTAAQNSEQRILFIGNSYTAGVSAALQQTLSGPDHPATELQFITKGGATLEKHLNYPATTQAIKDGQWTYVVLQEQSQTPALGGHYTQSFHQSVDQLSRIIKDAGATPVLYATWGRRDGDSKNKAIFPDFETMNAKLTTAYQQAAARNGALIAPVGQAWAAVKKQDQALWHTLYRKDGSHPSANGAYLTACVFSQRLFPQAATEKITAPGTLKANEQATIRQAARATALNLNQ